MVSRSPTCTRDRYSSSIYSCTKVVDLNIAGQLEAWGLSTQDLVSDEMDRCREVADVAARIGAEGIRWSSATGSGQSIAIFFEQLRPGSHADIVRAL